ncbi:MAG: hypothetical protein NT118_07855, partial [Lentisphaerae bacterium]|nr:hypothetical protein [Lentisphaerota bacterium]
MNSPSLKNSETEFLTELFLNRSGIKSVPLFMFCKSLFAVSIPSAVIAYMASFPLNPLFIVAGKTGFAVFTA